MAKRCNRNRVNATGRNPTDRFVRLPFSLLISNAYRSINPNARVLLSELLMLYNGENNGSLYLSVRNAAQRIGVADLSAASRAFDDLMTLGFIELAQDAHFSVKAADASRARCWRLTWLAGPGRKAPSWDFLGREPEPRTKAYKRMERGLKALKEYRKARDRGRLPILDFDTLSPFRPDPSVAAVSESNTLAAENGGFLPNCLVRHSATHIATPWGEGGSHQFLGWWNPNWGQHISRLVFFASLLTSQPNQTLAGSR